MTPPPATRAGTPRRAQESLDDDEGVTPTALMQGGGQSAYSVFSGQALFYSSRGNQSAPEDRDIRKNVPFVPAVKARTSSPPGCSLNNLQDEENSQIFYPRAIPRAGRILGQQGS